jgi:hypothetical protein
VMLMVIIIAKYHAVSLNRADRNMFMP